MFGFYVLYDGDCVMDVVVVVGGLIVVVDFVFFNFVWMLSDGE